MPMADAIGSGITPASIQYGQARLLPSRFLSEFDGNPRLQLRRQPDRPDRLAAGCGWPRRLFCVSAIDPPVLPDPIQDPPHSPSTAAAAQAALRRGILSTTMAWIRR